MATDVLHLTFLHLIRMHTHDTDYMAMALAEARKAAALGEVPVGAVVVGPGDEGAGTLPRVLARGHNHTIGLHDPTAHAEVVALRAAAAAIGNYRLDGCTLYVTLEPCAMCAQALLHARLARVVYGAREPKTGADGSVVDVLRNPALNHHTEVVGGVDAKACAALLRSFFVTQREQARQRAVPLRDDALRTPDSRFEAVWARFPQHRAESHRAAMGEAAQGLRLHWLDVLPSHPLPYHPVAVALHGPDAWWPQWAGWAQARANMGWRVLLPDLVGFGLSDKPKKSAWHTVSRHAAVLADWLQALAVPRVALTTVPEHEPLALALKALLPEVVQSLDWCTPELVDGLPPGWRQYPFADTGYWAGPRAWPWPVR